MVTRFVSCWLIALACLGCGGEFPVDARTQQLAADHADTRALLDALERIESWHASHGTGLELRAGRDAAALTRRLRGSDLHATDELVALYGWHDGEARADALDFVWGFDFLPLDDAIGDRRWLRWVPLLGWDADYLPILSFQGEWFAVDCGREGQAGSPVVHLFLEDSPRVAFTNLTTMMRTMAEAMESGAIRWDSEVGAMVDDVQAVSEIHARLNPGAEFPYAVPE